MSFCPFDVPTNECRIIVFLSFLDSEFHIIMPPYDINTIILQEGVLFHTEHQFMLYKSKRVALKPLSFLN